MRDRPLPRIVVIITALALLPLAAGFVLIVAPGLAPIAQARVEQALLGYGVLLLGFLGGIRWGMNIMDATGTDRSYVLSALVVLVGLMALLLPFGPGMALLIVGFAGQGAWDAWSGQKKTIPDHYARPRAALTLAICLFLIVTLLVYAGMH